MVNASKQAQKFSQCGPKLLAAFVGCSVSVPFKAIESEHLLAAFRIANPLITKLPSRHEISASIVQLGDKIAYVIRDELNGRLSKVTVLLDIWSTKTCRSYLCILLQYVKDDGQCVTRAVALKPVTGAHTGDAIRHDTDMVLAEFGVAMADVSRFVTDAASSNRRAFKDVDLNTIDICDGDDNDCTEPTVEAIDNEWSDDHNEVPFAERLDCAVHQLQLDHIPHALNMMGQTDGGVDYEFVSRLCTVLTPLVVAVNRMQSAGCTLKATLPVVLALANDWKEMSTNKDETADAVNNTVRELAGYCLQCLESINHLFYKLLHVDECTDAADLTYHAATFLSPTYYNFFRKQFNCPSFMNRLREGISDLAAARYVFLEVNVQLSASVVADTVMYQLFHYEKLVKSTRPNPSPTRPRLPFCWIRSTLHTQVSAMGAFASLPSCNDLDHYVRVGIGFPASAPATAGRDRVRSFLVDLSELTGASYSALEGFLFQLSTLEDHIGPGEPLAFNPEFAFLMPPAHEDFDLFCRMESGEDVPMNDATMSAISRVNAWFTLARVSRLRFFRLHELLTISVPSAVGGGQSSTQCRSSSNMADDADYR